MTSVHNTHPHPVMSYASHAAATPSTTAAPSRIPKVIFFTDFDGTITRTDTNHVLVDTFGCSRADRLAREGLVVSGESTFRAVWGGLYASVAAKLGIAEACEYLYENIRLDPAFARFWAWCNVPEERESSTNGTNGVTAKKNLGQKVDMVVLSGGMAVIIDKLLDNMLGRDKRADIRIVANNAGALEGCGGIDVAGGWEVSWHDDSLFGHDKSVEIRRFSRLPAAQRPLMFYAGDGISDYSAARETDLLFAKAGLPLVEYCEFEKIPHIPFEDFSIIQTVVEGVVEGILTIDEALARYGKTYA